LLIYNPFTKKHPLTIKIQTLFKEVRVGGF